MTMVNTRKYKKKGGWWPMNTKSTSIQPVQVDPNDCTVIANKSTGDIDAIVDKDKLERLVDQRNNCKVSNQSLKFTVDDTYIAGLIDKKKQINDQRKQRAKDRVAQQLVTNAEKHIKQARAIEVDTAKTELTECIQKTRREGVLPTTCPNYGSFDYLNKKHGGNRRTQRKHKKFKKAKSKRRSIKRRMNK